ncbi:hypothetical protein CCHR01_14883 [Colletotrichum chrysophilum]|uniref:Uncharacterized protein n=1 Tax=Colletotrichum chrysophilum TaxID=1836956 RepID=A0AAD9A8R0_9PEZI|nr:hypothetical protein CCHR01_14883 [Colletotrichum chrysophilum]
MLPVSRCTQLLEASSGGCRQQSFLPTGTSFFPVLSNWDFTESPTGRAPAGYLPATPYSSGRHRGSRKPISPDNHTTSTMPETSVSEAALAAVPDEVRWCLRCLGWYAGEFKGNRGQFCQDVDFACSGAVGGPDEKCARCPPTAKHTCLTIPDSVWKLAREIIARRRAMVDFEKKNPMRDVSAAVSTLVVSCLARRYN